MKLVNLIVIGCLLTSPLYAVGSEGCTDKTVFLMHADTGFTEEDCSGDGAKSISTVGTPTISKTIVKLGSGAGSFDGTQALTYNALLDSDFAFGTGDFTIDYWINFTNTAQFGTCSEISIGDSVTGVYLNHTSTTNVRIFFVNTQYNFTVTAITSGTWYHYAVTRQGSTLTLWINGVSQGTQSDGSSVANSIGIFLMEGFDGSGKVNGVIDEFRIVKGKSEFNATFTPVTTAYCQGCEMSSFVGE